MPLKRLGVPLLAGSILLLSAGAAAPAAAAGAEKVFKADSVIWGFDFLSEDEMLVTLRNGELLHVDLARNFWKEVPHGLDVVVNGQGGLMDVHIEPDAGGGQQVYLTYSARDGRELTTALARGAWSGSELTGVETIFVAEVDGSSGRHFGSRLEFAGEHIYMTIGDRAERDQAQSLEHHNGKILRLTRDGKAAEGNPFASTPGALPEIWSYGHRNPQGIDSDADGTLYSIEFGPRGGDELNLVEPGLNYGWPLISHGNEYWGPSFDRELDGLEQPVIFWTPSISPSGMAFYQGDRFPEWKGNLFVAALGKTHLRRLVLDNGRVVSEEPMFVEMRERVRHVRTGFDGEDLYFATDNGNIYRVTP